VIAAAKRARQINNCHQQLGEGMALACRAGRPHVLSPSMSFHRPVRLTVQARVENERARSSW
jgi:hypothetical protein